jgi:hypothetical protein
MTFSRYIKLKRQARGSDQLRQKNWRGYFCTVQNLYSHNRKVPWPCSIYYKWELLGFGVGNWFCLKDNAECFCLTRKVETWLEVERFKATTHLTWMSKYQHELHLWIYYVSKFLNTSEFIIMINSRHILKLS